MSRAPELIERTPPYAEQATTLIRSFILSGEYAPGERLSELALSKQLGISRSPIREALQRLATDGLVDLVPGKGAHVAEFDQQRVQDLFHVREALEGMAAKLAAERATDEEVAHLDARLAEAGEALEAENAGYPVDIDFHREIAELSSNEWLMAKFVEIDGQLKLARSRSGGRPLRATDAQAEHEEILAAIVARDGDQAEALMRRHIRAALTSVLETLADDGEGPR